MDTADEPSMACQQVAGSEPIVQEEVIGYFDLGNPGLQLVGGDTFYLPTEALREHVLMSEHGKEGQPIIVVVEEGSQNVVVQAFSRDSEAVGEEAAFTMNQLDNAISATLPEQFAGVETITTTEGQQLLILSEGGSGKPVDTPVEDSAAAASDTGSSCHEGSKDNLPRQCVASLNSIQTELQPGCKELLEVNGSKEVKAIPDNVQAPEERAECKYESESKPHAPAPVDVQESNKTSGSCVSVAFGQGDNSEYQEKPVSPSMEPVQDTEQKKNGTMAMDVGHLSDGHSSDMITPPAQAIKPGTETKLNASEVPLAPSIAAEKLDTADLHNADKHTKEYAMCAVQDFKSSEAAGNTLAFCEHQGQGTSMDVACSPQTSSQHLIVDPATQPSLKKKVDKPSPMVAQHSDDSSGKSLKGGQSTKVCNERTNQSASIKLRNGSESTGLPLPLSQSSKHSSDCSAVTGPQQKSMEPEASKHSVTLRAGAATALAKSKVGQPPQYETTGSASNRNTLVLSPEPCPTPSSSNLEASSPSPHHKQQSLVEKEGTACTHDNAVNEESVSSPVTTSVEKNLECEDKHADFNIEPLPSASEELSQTSRSVGAYNSDKLGGKNTSDEKDCSNEEQAEILDKSMTEEPGKKSLIDETLKVQPATSSLSNNIITDIEQEKCQSIEKDNTVTKLCDVINECSELPQDFQTKSSQREKAFHSGEMKVLHEIPKKQNKKLALNPVATSHVESKLQGSPNNDGHKVPVHSQASSKLDTDENKLRETFHNNDALPCEPADSNVNVHDTECQRDKKDFEHFAPHDGNGGLQELHNDEHQEMGACERTAVKTTNQNIQEQEEEGQTWVTDEDSPSVPEALTSCIQNVPCSPKAKGSNSAGARNAIGSGDKLLAALDLVPRQEASPLPPDDTTEPCPPPKEQDVTAKELCTAPKNSDEGDKETEPKEGCSDGQEDDSPSKRRWSLRTPTKPRKRVIIPDSDDEDFEAYASENVPTVAQKSKSEQAFDDLLDFFKKEQAQKAAVKTAPTRKRNAKKVGLAASKSASARSRSSAANSIPFEKESTVKTDKVKDVVKPTARKSQPVSTPCTTSRAAVVKQARKRRSEPVKVVAPKKSFSDGVSSRIPSISDTFAGDIRIRCQKPGSSLDKMASRYHCSKCGFRSSRMENIVRHHKQDCPYSKQNSA
ncbi:uncharacterized protein [Dermacentor andersoni]|uniref:uncharacterized protein isoform X1 n=2 Tax=Dermacentor andersoni TaxID=34620 RepID=UPI002155DB48|nr:uncharacterized protein LOC126546000 isoform X1 [Dermacentor andersoni]XP_050050009.1 uncharacterized protein LOC126546000 isoform X1 [Dermacentor andersoni]